MSMQGILSLLLSLVPLDAKWFASPLLCASNIVFHFAFLPCVH